MRTKLCNPLTRSTPHRIHAINLEPRCHAANPQCTRNTQDSERSRYGTHGWPACGIGRWGTCHTAAHSADIHTDGHSLGRSCHYLPADRPRRTSRCCPHFPRHLAPLLLHCVLQQHASFACGLAQSPSASNLHRDVTRARKYQSIIKYGRSVEV